MNVNACFRQLAWEGCARVPPTLTRHVLCLALRPPAAEAQSREGPNPLSHDPANKGILIPMDMDSQQHDLVKHALDAGFPLKTSSLIHLFVGGSQLARSESKWV